MKSDELLWQSVNLIKDFRDYKTIDTTAIKYCLDVPDTFSIDAAQKSFATFLKESKKATSTSTMPPWWMPLTR